MRSTATRTAAAVALAIGLTTGLALSAQAADRGGAPAAPVNRTMGPGGPACCAG